MDKENETQKTQSYLSDKIWLEAWEIQGDKRLYRKEPLNLFMRFLVGGRLHDKIMDKIENIKSRCSGPTDFILYDDDWNF